MIRITTDIFCDKCGNWEHGGVDARPQPGKARRIAKEAGWLLTKDGDFCPRCAARLLEVKG